MVNFKHVVLQILNESGIEKTTAGWFFELDDVNKPKALSPESHISEITLAYEGKYGNGTFPNYDKLRSIFNAWQLCWTRTSAAQLIGYSMYFPMISFMADIALQTGATKAADAFNTLTLSKEIFDRLKDGFVKSLKEVTSANPIDFRPILSPQAQYISTQILKDNQREYLATASLEKHFANNIKDAVYKLLEVRKKARLATLSNASVPDQGNAVKDVLVHPDKYSGGQYAFSSKVSSDKIYTRAIHTELVTIGLLAKGFFEFEAMRLGSEESPISIEDTEYESFLNNTPMSEGNLYAFHQKNSGEEVLATDVGQGGYIIKNIKALGMTGDNDPALKLYNALLSFANYVREGEVTDWIKVAQGAKQIAKGLSLGTPNLGGKR